MLCDRKQTQNENNEGTRYEPIQIWTYNCSYLNNYVNAQGREKHNRMSDHSPIIHTHFVALVFLFKSVRCNTWCQTNISIDIFLCFLFESCFVADEGCFFLVRFVSSAVFECISMAVVVFPSVSTFNGVGCGLKRGWCIHTSDSHSRTKMYTCHAQIQHSPANITKRVKLVAFYQQAAKDWSDNKSQNRHTK